MFYVFVACGAYLLGSFPSGYLIGRARGVDLRAQGSGNIGATNALRVLGKKWGYLCFALDIGKGMSAVWLAKFAAAASGYDLTWAAVIAAAAVITGHTFPVWLEFKGGKGIATSGGVAIALFPIEVFLLSIGLWALVFHFSRIVSVASFAATFTLGLVLVVDFALGRVPLPLLVIGLIMSALVIWLHRANLRRLWAGTEPRFERKRPV